ncbi:hypothetical protein V6N12_042156 [Hibiscus sabdariffa]|uniref:Uncharacterized protein n=1 Tax=Hibiscus sabdariffa TaxID=183260 RepID=A0ABR2EDY0_9ROSI
MAETEKENRKESNDRAKEDACEIDIKQLIIDNQRQRRPSSRQCCIYRAQVVRDVDTAAFTPKIVSIGPLHHSKPHLKGMEETKINYLEQFLGHAANTARLHEQNHLKENNIEDAIAFLGWKGTVIQGGNDFTLLGQLLDILRRSEQDIRSCYAENLKGIDSEEFLRLVLVDAAFIIELFLRYHFCSPDFDLWDVMQLPLYQFILIRSDLWLLENQIPYFVLENLYVTAFGSYPQIYPPFLELAFKIFDIYNRWKMKPEAVKGKGIKHFTDLIRAFYLQPLGNSEEQNSNENMFFPLLDHLPSATQLHDAGVRHVAAGDVNGWGRTPCANGMVLHAADLCMCHVLNEGKFKGNARSRHELEKNHGIRRKRRHLSGKRINENVLSDGLEQRPTKTEIHNPIQDGNKGTAKSNGTQN